MVKEWKGLPVVIIGQGGLGKKIEATLKEVNKYAKNNVYDFLGYLDDNDSLKGNENYLGKIEILKELSNEKLIGVVFGIGNPNIKKLIYEKIKDTLNIVFPNIIHPNVFIYDDMKMGVGNVIASGVNICTDVKIGDFNFINLSSTIGHDVEIKNFAVINPLVSISGNVMIEDEVLLGTGANVLQNLIIRNKCKIGAGSVITKDCFEGKIYIGVPGKEKTE